jgi:hypothetical protein
VSTHYMTSTAQRFPLLVAEFRPHKASQNTKTKLFSLQSYWPQTFYPTEHYRLSRGLQCIVLKVEYASNALALSIITQACIHSALLKT